MTTSCLGLGVPLPVVCALFRSRSASSSPFSLLISALALRSIPATVSLDTLVSARFAVDFMLGWIAEAPRRRELRLMTKVHGSDCGRWPSLTGESGIIHLELV